MKNKNQFNKKWTKESNRQFTEQGNKKVSKHLTGAYLYKANQNNSKIQVHGIRLAKLITQNGDEDVKK